MLEPQLKDFTGVFGVLAERYSLHEVCPCKTLPGRDEIEQRLPSPLYAGETLQAFSNARELAPGVIGLRNIPAFGAYLATEQYPIVVQVNTVSSAEATVSAIFFREAELHAIDALADTVELVWAAARAGSVVDEFAKSNTLSRSVADLKDAVASRQKETTVSLRRPVDECAVPVQQSEVVSRGVTSNEHERALRVARAAGK